MHGGRLEPTVDRWAYEMRARRLITTGEARRLFANGRWNAARRARGIEVVDLYPVVRFCCPWSAASWLLTELDPRNSDLAHAQGPDDLASTVVDRKSTAHRASGMRRATCIDERLELGQVVVDRNERSRGVLGSSLAYIAVMGARRVAQEGRDAIEWHITSIEFRRCAA